MVEKYRPVDTIRFNPVKIVYPCDPILYSYYFTPLRSDPIRFLFSSCRSHIVSIKCIQLLYDHLFELIYMKNVSVLFWPEIFLCSKLINKILIFFDFFQFLSFHLFSYLSRLIGSAAELFEQPVLKVSRKYVNSWKIYEKFLKLNYKQKYDD